MKKLILHSAANISTITEPKDYQEITLRSPATSVLTDFNNQLPLMIDASLPATEVEYLMKSEHVRLKLVVDEDNKFVGVITLKNLNSQEIIKKVASDRIDRESFSVQEFMQPKSDIMVLDIDDVRSSSIQDIISSLSLSRQQHILIMEHGSQDLIGLISCSDIIKKLRLPLNIHSNHSFYQIFELLESSKRLYA